MTKSYRQERLNESIKELLSELIQSGIKDPRIGFVTITGVEVARDLTSAKVFFSVLGDKDARDSSLEGLKSARNFLRKKVGQELKLRNAPELRFKYDETLDRSLALEDTIRKIREKDDLDKGEM